MFWLSLVRLLSSTSKEWPLDVTNSTSVSWEGRSATSSYHLAIRTRYQYFSATTVLILFYCRHIFVSIELGKSLCYLLGRILVLATAFKYLS